MRDNIASLSLISESYMSPHITYSSSVGNSFETKHYLDDYCEDYLSSIAELLTWRLL